MKYRYGNLYTNSLTVTDRHSEKVRRFFMPYKYQRTSYKFTDTAKASMVVLLEQFPPHLETITEIREALRRSGSVILDTHQAIILASLVRVYWPPYADQLMAPLENYPRPADEYEARFQLVLARIQGFDTTVDAMDYLEELTP